MTRFKFGHVTSDRFPFPSAAAAGSWKFRTTKAKEKDWK